MPFLHAIARRPRGYNENLRVEGAAVVEVSRLVVV